MSEIFQHMIDFVSSLKPIGFPIF